ncbi:hypothetical protein ABIB80_007949 [Bradyrhizobium sp. i1.15.2]|uniref:hypothetical protein n=1 Tax=Bradyrhizobium sp. i1.15.2 TaxID=3156362 RepID=UPI00339B582D
MGIVAALLITMGIPFGLAKDHGHHLPATTAAHQAGQQCTSPRADFREQFFFMSVNHDP